MTARPVVAAVLVSLSVAGIAQVCSAAVTAAYVPFGCWVGWLIGKCPHRDRFWFRETDGSRRLVCEQCGQSVSGQVS